MNINDSLLGHLASRLSPHPENVATEALAFILSRSEHVRRAVLQFLEGLGVPPPHVVFFGAQKAEENNARPDLRGVDENGTPVLFIEAKFWAGLTDRQPVAYLAALPTDRPTALLVVAPEARRQTLWRELLRRCAVGIQGGATELGHGHGPHSITQIGPSKFLVLVAWKPFLESLRSAAYAQGDRVSAEDLNQLLGLCTREDTTAFLPLRSEELSAGVGRRLYQFATLVDEVCDEAVRQGICSSKGTSGSGKIYYWRRVRLVEHEFTLQFRGLQHIEWAGLRTRGGAHG